jgi:hypothetical protein
MEHMPPVTPAFFILRVAGSIQGEELFALLLMSGREAGINHLLMSVNIRDIRQG